MQLQPSAQCGGQPVGQQCMLSPLVHLQLLGSQRMLELEELIAAVQHADHSAHHSVLRWFDNCALAV
jgi:hypothetical protein